MNSTFPRWPLATTLTCPERRTMPSSSCPHLISIPFQGLDRHRTVCASNRWWTSHRHHLVYVVIVVYVVSYLRELFRLWFCRDTGRRSWATLARSGRSVRVRRHLCRGTNLFRRFRFFQIQTAVFRTLCVCFQLLGAGLKFIDPFPHNSASLLL